MKPKYYLWIYVGLLFGYTIFSYTLVDRNIVLFGHWRYWDMQRWLWHWWDSNREIMVVGYAMLVSGIFGVYLLICRWALSGVLEAKSLGWASIGSVLALFFSYPGLSHDVFNYLFNAKMVLVYSANPHVKVALDFASDPWLGFMHNVHTTAPYGYGWTGISLLPAGLSFWNVKLGILWMRVLMIGALYLLALVQYRLAPDRMRLFVWVFLLNPLVLIETVSNVHNDVVMMGLLLSGVWVFTKWWRKRLMLALIFGGALIGLSVSIKYASLMVVAGLLIEWAGTRWGRKISFGGSQMLAHALPLFTARSQRFLPWYLIWSLSFLPLTKEAWIRGVFVWGSLAGLLAYVPYLWFGNYTEMVLMWRSVILYGIPAGYLGVRLLRRKRYG